MVSFRLLPIALLTAATRAQWMNVTFYVSNDDGHQCTQGDSTVTIRTRAPVPERSICFNMNDTFGNASVAHQNGNYTCPDVDEPCEFRYTLEGLESFNPNANYSQVLYSQFGLGSSQGLPGALTFQTYEGEQCLRNATQESEPWIRWNCQGEGLSSCDSVPYNIRSFAISPATRYTNPRSDDKDEQCVTRADYGVSAAPPTLLVKKSMLALTVVALGSTWLL